MATTALKGPGSDLLWRRFWAAAWLVFAAWLLYRAIFVGAGSAYVTEMNGRVLEASRNDFIAGTAEYSLIRTVGVWFAAFLTLAVISFLYRDNACYKFSESIFVGVSAAYWMVVAFWTVMIPNLAGKIWPAWIQSWALPGLSPVREARWWLYFLPLILGVMLLWRLAPRGGWIARWPLAFIIGSFSGIRLLGFIQADFLGQINGSIQPLIVLNSDGGIDFGRSLQSMLLLASLLATLVYFFFSVEHKGVVGKVSRAGVWVLMITFGAVFAFTVMGRIALLASRFSFLFGDWLWLMPN
ncbi:hypothetical protein [Planctomicrobium sp. SH664]|uniref:hypothetical protein n=1 Tax=Planctomicrobium sp. SH664 TaxID=3448125 RepID=UPI003F5C6D1B